MLSPMPQNKSSSREDRVNEAIAAYLDAVERGEPPDRDKFLADHADLAAEWNTFLASRSQSRMATLHVAPGSTSQSRAPDSRPKQYASDPNEATVTFQQRDIPAARKVLQNFGDYELMQEIARGGMGVVYKARQVTLNRVVAVKMILGGQLAGPKDVQRFHTEAEAAAQLDHPGIVPIYEVGEQDGQHYFSMGFVEGQSLAKRVAEVPLEPRAAAEIVKTVAEAVQYAHARGVIHRDLKPGNILLDKEGKPRVTDFGLAKLTESGSDLTGTGQVLGTPSYMPPEQAAGKIEQIGPLADVYSLGAILYCLLTGRPPFQAASPMDTLLQVLEQEPVPLRELNPKIPRDLETIAIKCLEKGPARRYQSAQEVAKELQRFLTSEPIVARPISVIERGWRWCKRRPLIPSVVIAILSISIVAGLVFRHMAAVQRQQSLQREVVTAVDAVQNSRGLAIRFTLRDLERLPRELVLAELDRRYANAEPQHKLGLASARAAYDDVDVDYLCSQIQRAAADEVDNLVSALGKAREASMKAIEALAKQAESEQEWRLKGRLAVVALHLADDRLAADMCRIDERPDPIQRTLFIDEVSTWHGNVAPLAASCQALVDPGLRSGLCLAVGSISYDRSNDAEKEAWKSVLAEWYKTAPDTATHSSAGWALRQWGIGAPPLSGTSKPSDGQRWFVNSLGLTLLKFEPGAFVRKDEIPGANEQTVRLTRSFFLGDREISVGQFQQFIDDASYPSEEKPEKWPGPDEKISPTPDHPVQMVNWYDAVLFCNWLSRKEGRTACYERTGKTVKFQNGQNQDVEYDEWKLLENGTGYRLPTEAECQYACRAGTTTDFASGTDAELLRHYAVYVTGSMRGASACGSKLPNGWGLFDMHGNVWEWCHDQHRQYGDGDVNDPVGPCGGGSEQMGWGGGWDNYAMYCRSSGYRGWSQADSRRYNCGFRPALSSARSVQ